jgi:hypothetical protein
MSKLRSKPVAKASTSNYKPSAEDVKEEKKFFKVAIIVTVVLIALIFLLFSYMD